MSQARPPIGRWLLLQLALVIIVSALFLLKSPVSAGSALLGGLIYLLPQAYFAFKAFPLIGNRSTQALAYAMMFGGTVKLLLTAVLFAAVFAAVEPIDAMALLFTFAVVVVSHWLAPLGLRLPSQR